MAKFAIYKYDLQKSDEKHLFSQATSTAMSAREEFGKLLTGRSLNIYKNGFSGQPELFRTDNMFHEEIAVFTLENNKTIGQWLNKHKNNLPNNPYCWVIIDNRPGEMKMLIEDNSAWKSTDTVRDLLQQNFNGKLIEVGIEITIRAEMHENDFWKVIEQRCQKNKDVVKRIIFELINPEKAEGISVPNRRYAFLKSNLDLMQATNTYKTFYSMEANRRDYILLERTRRDLSQMVRYCCNNGYTIKVQFRKSREYVAGELERMYEVANEGLMTAFTSKQTIIADEGGSTYQLILWLNSISNNNTKKKTRHERTA